MMKVVENKHLVNDFKIACLKSSRGANDEFTEEFFTSMREGLKVFDEKIRLAFDGTDLTM